MTFSRLNTAIRKALAFEGYETPTPIQEGAIPPLLEGKDLMGIAQTGTGKTAAFLLPILEHFAAETRILPRGTPRALILAPTRELAAQIDDSCKKYGKHLRITHSVIFGGVSQGKQVQALRRGVDILVATPGRLLDLMQQGYVHLEKLEIFVLDEADRMLDMGFLPDVKRIVEKLPAKRQTMFFSATMSPEISRLTKTMLVDPVKVEVTPEVVTVEKINQQILFVDQQKKDALLWLLLEQSHLEKVLVFTRTKHRANKVTRLLNKKGVKTDAIHGNRSQSQRTQALNNFHRGKSRVLVATDIAARGIDVEDITHVINYDLPNEAENYVHRIGRTARAGKEGVAYSFCAADERSYLRDIEKLIKMTIPVKQHEFHSETARNATGAAAKPPPRGQRRGAPRTSRGARGRQRPPGIRNSRGRKVRTRRTPEATVSDRRPERGGSRPPAKGRRPPRRAGSPRHKNTSRR